jgi:uncharacterized membrane protein (UPF0127 family)
MRTLLVLFGLLLLSPVVAAPHHLPVEKVVIETQRGLRVFTLEIAADDASRETGLMHRTNLARNGGMLFDFGKPVMTAFWMKDTPLPLDMLFVRADGTISTVAARAVPFSTAEIVSAEPIRAVIEIHGGLAQALDIAPGDRVRAAIFPRASQH